MIRIVTDTTAALPDGWAARHNIPVVPQVIIFEDQEYLEMVDMDRDTFMARLVAAKTLPSTAAPAPAAFEAVYRPLVAAGDTILSIHPSAEISGTVRGATVAAQAFPGAAIHILDTRTIGGPLARLVMLAARLAAQGQSAAAILAQLQALIPRQRLYFLVDTLEYLQKGGRIGGAAALLGSLLQLKPILGLIAGRVEGIERQRTHRRVLERLQQLVVAEAASGDAAQLSIMHAGAGQQAAALAASLREALATDDILITDLVPAIVTHAGPGALAVGFFTTEES